MRDTTVELSIHLSGLLPLLFLSVVTTPFYPVVSKVEVWLGARVTKSTARGYHN